MRPSPKTGRRTPKKSAPRSQPPSPRPMQDPSRLQRRLLLLRLQPLRSRHNCKSPQRLMPLTSKSTLLVKVDARSPETIRYGGSGKSSGSRRTGTTLVHPYRRWSSDRNSKHFQQEHVNPLSLGTATWPHFVQTNLPFGWATIGLNSSPKTQYGHRSAAWITCETPL